MGKKEAILRMRTDEKSIRAIAQTIVHRMKTIRHVLKKTQEITGVPTSRCETGRS